MKNHIKYILIILFVLNFKNSLLASKEGLFFLSTEFNTILKKVQSSQEKNPFITGKISFATPKGHMEFKYILDLREKGTKHDTLFSQFSTNEEFWEDILQYYVLNIKYYPLKIKKKSLLYKKNNCKKNDTIYLKNTDENKLNKSGVKNINILVNYIKEMHAQTPVLRRNNYENNFNKDICIYPYFISMEKKYRGNENGVLKVFLTHENKRIAKNMPEIKSLAEIFKLIFLWIFEDLKIKIAQGPREIL